LDKLQKNKEEQRNEEILEDQNEEKKMPKSSKNEISDEEKEEEKAPTLTQEEMANLFRQTSSYTVQSVLKGNAVFYPKPGIHPTNDDTETDEDIVQNYQQAADYNMSDNDTEDGGDISETEFFGSSKEKRKGKLGNKKNNTDSTKRLRPKPGTKKLIQKKSEGGRVSGPGCIVKYDDKSGLASTKVGQRDIVMNRKTRKCSDENYARIPPPPFPPTWVHTVVEDVEENAEKNLRGSHYIEMDVIQMKKQDLPHTDYLAILVDAPFLLKNQDSEGILTMSDLSKLELGELTKNGILFVWTPSELILSVTETVEKWGFLFVEHATWVKQNTNNTFHVSHGVFFNVCKSNLLLFRKSIGKGKYGKLELRHQRTSDVYFDYMKMHLETKRALKSDNYAYELIETLLPNATKKCLRENVSTMLYLWAPKNEKRQGWTMVYDTSNRFVSVP